MSAFVSHDVTRDPNPERRSPSKPSTAAALPAPRRGSVMTSMQWSRAWCLLARRAFYDEVVAWRTTSAMSLYTLRTWDVCRCGAHAVVGGALDPPKRNDARSTHGRTLKAEFLHSRQSIPA